MTKWKKWVGLIRKTSTNDFRAIGRLCADRQAFHDGERFADEFPNAATVASGLRVPKAIGDFLILDALRESNGTAIAVTDEDLIAAVKEIGAAEGLFCAPEGAACLPALRELIEQDLVKENETVVIFNTGAGVKYLECFD